MSQLIASLEPGFIISAMDIQPGKLTKLSIEPLIDTVQTSSFMYFKFQSAHKLHIGAKIKINLPNGLVVPPVGSEIEVIGLPSPSSYPQPSTHAISGVVKADKVVEINDFVMLQERPKGFEYSFILVSLANQMACVDAGAWQITTYDQVDRQEYFVVDSAYEFASFVATAGRIEATGPPMIEDPITWLDNASYQFRFISSSMVPAKGMFEIEMPEDVSIDFEQALQSGSCLSNRCEKSGQHKISLEIAKAVQKKEEVSIKIEGIKNPRTFVPTGLFNVRSFESSVNGQLIDEGYEQVVQMTIEGSITNFRVKRLSAKNGVPNTFSFSLASAVPILKGDILSMTFPPQFTLSQSESRCENFTAQITCSVIGQQLKAVVEEDLASLAWDITQVRNPISLEPSQPFKSIFFELPSGYPIAKLQTPGGSVTNTEVNSLRDLSLTQYDYDALVETTYEIEFRASTYLPRTASILLRYPDSIVLGPEPTCTVASNKVYTDKCQVKAGEIVIQNAFAHIAEGSHFDGIVMITLEPVRNPVDNRQFAPFQISTFADTEMLYQIDYSEELRPSLACEYPCATCQSENRRVCLSCFYFDANIPHFFQVFPGGQQTCLDTCAPGYTSNGNPEKKCERCDRSCGSCEDNGQAGDYKRCKSCSDSFPFKFQQYQCLQECRQGLYLPFGKEQEKTCEKCSDDCFTCEGSATECTSCKANSNVPYLHQGSCRAECPADHTPISGVCQPCSYPCATCSNSPQACSSCHTDTKNNILFGNLCLASCPDGYATDYANRQCFGCLSGCDQCSAEDTQTCLLCREGLGLWKGKCETACPSGFKIIDRVCQPGGTEDLKQLQYPFLIAAILMGIIVLVGKFKKKAILNNGKLEMVFQQHSVSAAAAFFSLLQATALMTQTVLAVIERQPLVSTFTLLVVLAYLNVNILFLCWFRQNFMRTYLPKVGSRVVLKKKEIDISVSNQHLHPQSVDVHFNNFRQKHRFTTMLALAGSIAHFEVFKLLYSQFFSFDMFKARFSNADKFQQKMVKLQKIAFVLDALVILVSIIGCLQPILRSSASQLFVTMQETLILAICLTIFKLYEIKHQKTILASISPSEAKYSKSVNLRPKLKLQVLQMKKLTAFKTRKIEELLELFGKRMCHTCIESLHDYEKQADPRETISWPLSPSDAGNIVAKIEHGFRFQLPKQEGRNFLQSKLDMAEFVKILGTKRGEIVSEAPNSPDSSHTILISKKGRRGRMSAYQQILQKEDQEEQSTNMSDYEALLRMQAEEEQKLRRLVEISKNKSQEITRNKDKHSRNRVFDEERPLSTQRTSNRR